MDDDVLGRKVIQPKQVKEETAENPLYKFSYSQYVKDELNKSISSDSKIPGLEFSALNKSSFSASATRVAELSRRAIMPVIRVLVFAVLLVVLYGWNIKFFRFGDFQTINYAEERCSEVNRFDFSADTWQEELTISNMNNLKAKYQFDKHHDQVKLKIEKLQSILDRKSFLASEASSHESTASN